jgi:hypothetical protein
MRELTKSMIGLPWALSMFGVQQAANLMAPPSAKRMGDTADAFDAVSHAAEQGFDGWMLKTYKMGDGLQRAMVDAMFLKPPSIDASALMRAASEMQGSPLFQFGLQYVLPPVAWADSFLVSGKDSSATLQEFTNKLYVIQLVAQVETRLGLDKAGDTPLTDLVARAETLDTFARLWAIEGLGNYYAERSWDRTPGTDPHDLLTDPSAADLPSSSLTMLHAGIGMSFANRLLRNLGSAPSPGAVREAVVRFAGLCRGSSRPGYAGAALESLGLATRTLYPEFVALVDRELPAVDPSLVGYFWHGVGRAVYFDPTTLLPSFNAPWRSIAKLAHDTPDEHAHFNALSGFSWAVTVVNMRTPEVMEAVLRHHGTTLAQSPAFTNGVSSVLMMRYDTTPDDSHLQPFLAHEPSMADPTVVAAWNTLITQPGTDALNRTYPALLRASRLEELFHYVPASAEG